MAQTAVSWPLSPHFFQDFYRDRIDTDNAYRRGKLQDAIIDRFGLSDNAHEWLEQSIISTADVEDAAADHGLLMAIQVSRGSFQIQSIEFSRHREVETTEQ